jgi:hypothetical protein
MALYVGGCSTPRSGCLTTVNDPLHSKLSGPRGRSGQGRKISPPSGARFPCCSAPSEMRLSPSQDRSRRFEVVVKEIRLSSSSHAVRNILMYSTICATDGTCYITYNYLSNSSEGGKILLKEPVIVHQVVKFGFVPNLHYFKRVSKRVLFNEL